MALLLALSSCATTKDIAYVQIANQQAEYARQEAQDSKILPKDILTVTIQASQPELVAAFNGIYWTPTQQYQTSTTQGIRTYLVDNDGIVDLPILGQIKIGGLTMREAEAAVRDALASYFNETPSVNIQMKNFRYSVLGEVNGPGSFVADNGRVTVFEALANARDLTIHGMREEVRLIRQNPDGSQLIITLNLKDPEILASPYYYLQQGDVLYVMPNEAKASSSSISAGTTIWVSIASIGLSIANLLVNVLR